MTVHSRPARWLAALALCGACEVGDPLVDRLSPRGQSGSIPAPACSEPPPCEEAPRLALELREPKPLHWQGCPVDCDGSSSATSDRALALDCVTREPLHELNADLSCVTKRFTAGASAPALSAGENISASKVRWTSSNVIIEAERPLDIAISAVELRDVRLDLVGPITLRFDEHSSLENVAVSSASEHARVVLDGVQSTGLVVGDAEQRFAGHLEARHSTLSHASLRVESAELDSVRINAAFLGARELVANDGQLSLVTLDVAHATFAPAELEAIAVTRCESLSFFGASLENVAIPRCSGEPTRIYACRVLTSRLDGEVSGDSSSFENVHLGVDEPTELELWGVKVGSSTFCDQVESVKVSYNAVTCSTCSEDAVAKLQDGCVLPIGDFEDLASFEAETADAGLRSNFCEALDMFEPCPAPLPMRPRPIGELND